MRNASGQQGATSKVKMNVSERKKKKKAKRNTSTKNKIFGEHINFFFIKSVTGKCYVVVVQNSVKELYI